jgi:hypothetical protein
VASRCVDARNQHTLQITCNIYFIGVWEAQAGDSHFLIQARVTHQKGTAWCALGRLSYDADRTCTCLHFQYLIGVPVSVAGVSTEERLQGARFGHVLKTRPVSGRKHTEAIMSRRSCIMLYSGAAELSDRGAAELWDGSTEPLLDKPTRLLLVLSAP